MEPGCLLSRMSGSGATCFGLYETETQAKAAIARIGRIGVVEDLKLPSQFEENTVQRVEVIAIQGFLLTAGKTIASVVHLVVLLFEVVVHFRVGWETISPSHSTL